MSKKVKELLQKEVAKRLDGIEAVAVLNPRGIGAIVNNQIRRRLREKNMRMTVVKNTLAVRATAGGKLKGFEKLLDGPSAIVYGKGVSVSAIARALLDEKKTIEDNKGKLEIRGAFFDSEVYVGDKGMETASKLPTREEAIAAVVSALLGPGCRLASALARPGAALAGAMRNHPGATHPSAIAEAVAGENPTSASSTLGVQGAWSAQPVVGDRAAFGFPGGLVHERLPMGTKAHSFLATFPDPTALDRASADPEVSEGGVHMRVVSRRWLQATLSAPLDPGGNPERAELLESVVAIVRDRYGADVVEDEVLEFHAAGGAVMDGEGDGATTVLDRRRDITPLLPDDAAAACMRTVSTWIGMSNVESGARASEVVLAIVDSGINGALPEFSDASGIRAGGSAPPGVDPWGDEIGHGTMCASIAAASGAAHGRFDGVAAGARLYSARVADANHVIVGGHVIAAYDALLDFMESNRRVRLVVNNTWGASLNRPWSTAFDRLGGAVTALVNAGAVVLFSAGNDHGRVGGHPGECRPSSIGKLQSREDILVVGACREDTRHVWHYSSRGPGQAGNCAKPDVVAPVPQYGRVVYRDQIYRIAEGWGTSGACPQAAGLCVLALSHVPTLSHRELFEAIRTSATPLPGVAANCQGSGRIHCRRTFNALGIP